MQTGLVGIGTAERDVAPGESWAFREHRTLAEIEAPRRFDAVAAWDRLEPERQRRIGAYAMLFAYAIDAADELNETPVDRADSHAFEAAICAGYQGLLAEFTSAEPIPPDLILDGEVFLAPARPDLAVFGIRQCTGCGCTDECGCPGGCSWAGPRLCSSCAAIGAAAGGEMA